MVRPRKSGVQHRGIEVGLNRLPRSVQRRRYQSKHVVSARISRIAFQSLASLGRSLFEFGQPGQRLRLHGVRAAPVKLRSQWSPQKVERLLIPLVPEKGVEALYRVGRVSSVHALKSSRLAPFRHLLNDRAAR